ncbi:enolase [Stenotrophomonas sp. C1657]|uniref:enolase n=1 Tax=Stenotrophomonas sp. C1657 TaxID=3077844 RepID=UPI00293C5394|nr:enolase [Stenotrophomonas sp. C1657]MDV3513364.1 enolase [Stenotrophomonas sp. C1657]
MIHQTELRDLLPGMVPFPADVFPDDQAWLGQHLLPLLKIDLGVLRPELSGNVATMLCPIEPYDGCIGETTEEHHNAFTGTNWIAFELTSDNRMRFLGEEGYFIGDQVQDKHALKHITEMRGSYSKARAYFQQHGRLASYSRYGDGEPGEQAWLDTLGGAISYGNWTETAEIPAAFEISILPPMHDRDRTADMEDVTITRDGNKFFAVAEVAGYNWCATGADAIVMLYEPESRTVLFSYDWS